MNYTKINIGSQNLVVTMESALVIARALKLPRGVATFKDMVMEDCIRINEGNVEYYQGGKWHKILSEYQGHYLTEEEINEKISDAVKWGAKEF